MTEIVNYDDIAKAMGRSPAVFKTFASLSRPRTMGWVNIKRGTGKQPTRYYPIEDVVMWLARAYAHFDAGVEMRIRAIARANSAKFEAA